MAKAYVLMNCDLGTEKNIVSTLNAINGMRLRIIIHAIHVLNVFKGTNFFFPLCKIKINPNVTTVMTCTTVQNGQSALRINSAAIKYTTNAIPRRFHQNNPGINFLFFIDFHASKPKNTNHSAPKTATGTLNNSENSRVFTREHETEEVKSLFEASHVKIYQHDYTEAFLSELKGVTEPEKKRKIIGRVFIEAFEEVAREIEGIDYLAQGTLYPDIIESGAITGHAVTIKSHHNVGGLPEKMSLKVIEPFKELFKDEVRAVGRVLNVPAKIIGRHPFPGPGLAVRCLGAVSEDRLSILRAADQIFIDTLYETGWYDKIWQAFTVLLPIQTVGVMGDKRTYENVLAIRAVHSLDGMTADWVRIPYEIIADVSSKIVNSVSGVNRVVYDVTSKPPGTIEWE